MSPVVKKSPNPVPIKNRMKVPRQLMPEQPAEERAHNFEEVNLGYSEELARQEAQRLPGMRQANLHRPLPGRREGEGIC
jgi:hypothetical protein